MPLVPFEQLPRCWSSERVNLSKSMQRPLKRNCLELKRNFLEIQQCLSSTTSIPAGFYRQKLWGLVFLALEPWAWGPVVGLG